MIIQEKVLKIGFFYKKGALDAGDALNTAGGFYGEVNGENVFRLGNDFRKVEGAGGARDAEKLSGLEISAPSRPTKIVAVGLNYLRHTEEMNFKLPETPLLFLKPSSSILPSRGSIIYPSSSSRVDYEAELGIVIKKTAKNVTEQEAAGYILGYTAFNDVTARDLQSLDGQWTRAKGFDTFSPYGPFIETELKPGNLRIQAILNGAVRQDSSTADMIFGVFKLVSFISSVMTLYPGDVIASGTPGGIGEMKRGDQIIIRIEGLDDLVNKVA